MCGTKAVPGVPWSFPTHGSNPACIRMQGGTVDDARELLQCQFGLRRTEETKFLVKLPKVRVSPPVARY